MFPAIIGAAGAALGSGISAIGQSKANKANLKIAREQMAFQERMRDTAWQSAVKDMQLAGLNPALAYEKGGADSPSGASANMENALAGMGSTAAQAASTFSNISLQQAQAKKTNAEADYVAARANAEIALMTGQLRQTGVNTAKAQQDIDWKQHNWDREAARIWAESRSAEYRAQYDRETLPARVATENLLPKVREEELGLLKQKKYLTGLTENEAKAWSEFYGGIGKGMPWVSSALDVLKLIPGLGKLFKSPSKTIINQFRRP